MFSWVFDRFYFDAVEIVFGHAVLKEPRSLLFNLLPVARIDG